MWLFFALIFIISRSFEFIYAKQIIELSDALSFSFFRLITIIIFLIPLFIINWPLTSDHFTIIILNSILAAAGVYCRTQSLKTLDLSYVNPLLSLSSVIVYIIALITLKEELSVVAILGLMIVCSSLYIINIENTVKWYSPFSTIYKLKGGIWLVLAIVLFSITPVLDRYILQQIDVMDYLLLMNFFMPLSLAGPIIISKIKIIERAKFYKEYFFKFLLIGLLAMLSFASQYGATSLQKVSIVTPILSMHTILIVLGSGLFLKEKKIKVRIIAGLFAILGCYLLTS